MTCNVTYRRSPGDGKKVVRALKLKDPDNDRYLFDGVEEPGKAVAWEEAGACQVEAHAAAEGVQNS